MTSTTGFQAHEGWSFDGIRKGQPDAESSIPSQEVPDQPLPATSEPGVEPSTEPEQNASASHSEQAHQEIPRQRHYPPRTCRICFDVVQPSFDLPNENIPTFLQREPQVKYESSPEDGGRLLRPCKCKGFSKYVHEGCLHQWRMANPSNAGNYYECPTCKFRYQLSRVRWANWIGSTTAELALTILILIFTTFLLGFVADPIINLWLDDDYEHVRSPRGRPPPPPVPDTWAEHFVKGFASLGLLSFLRGFFGGTWLHFGRWNFGLGGGNVRVGGQRPGGRGRDRLEGMTWVVVVVGVITFLYSVFKGVRALSKRTLSKLHSQVMDVQGDDDDEEEEENVPDSTQPASNSAPRTDDTNSAQTSNNSTKSEEETAQEDAANPQ